MNNRKLSIECLTNILYKNKTFDEAFNAVKERSESSAFLYNLIITTLKNLLYIDYSIQFLVKKPLNRIKKPILCAIRLAIAEMDLLDKPEYAVISDYVTIVKKQRKELSGFTNAVLRNYSKQKKAILNKINSESIEKQISIKFSHPQWMINSWIEQYGLENTKKICEFNNKHSIQTLRVNTLKSTPEELESSLNSNKILFSKSLIKDCINLSKSNKITEIPGFKEGLWTVQGEASALVSLVLAPQINDSVLDICAAPGGKTTHIASIMKNTGEITAVDSSEKRLLKVQENYERLGISNVTTLCADATEYNFEKLYDKILIDAPCSNTGVLAKRPDARYKRKEEDIQNLAEIQLKILNNVVKYLKPKGEMVYSTCSIEKTENNDVINKFLIQNPEFEIISIKDIIPFKTAKDIKSLQITQFEHNMDGFFICKLKRL